MKENKSIWISKDVIWKSWLSVKANAGSAGIDEESIKSFKSKSEDELYKLWNRMSSGSYFPPCVKGVEIPKRDGRKRLLGIPTVADRVAQTTVKMLIEERLEKIFDRDSYGYRPGRSAHDALAVTRERCWKMGWVLEYDIKGLFDNIPHDLLMKAVEFHIEEKWIRMYIKRWLQAPLVGVDGQIQERTKGTPQGGVISPLLANLFLHYCLDAWTRRELPNIPFCRYSDDGLFHCVSKGQAEYVRIKIENRAKECGIELHPVKTKIIECSKKWESKEKGSVSEYRSFDFLGYEFKTRLSASSKGKKFVDFNPSISESRLKDLRKTIKHRLNELKRTEICIEDIAKKLNPITRGWFNYYGKFRGSALRKLWIYINERLAIWLSKKYKPLRRRKARARELLNKIKKGKPYMFEYWSRC
jgi:RNA-directed DNA polymerase